MNDFFKKIKFKILRTRGVSEARTRIIISKIPFGDFLTDKFYENPNPDDETVGDHYVYAIELAEDAIFDRILSPQADTKSPEGKCLYVGMTGLTPEERFLNHIKGHRASRIVKKFGLNIFQRRGPMTREKAEHMEVKWAKELRNQGHAVHQN
jgi:hypothetical protein